MIQPLLVVARSTSVLNRFAQDSLQGALNVRDFLEQTGENDAVTTFQVRSVGRAMKGWVALSGMER